MNDALVYSARSRIEDLEAARTYKRFNVLRSPQGPLVEMEGRGEVIVLSSNDYLGLANDPEVVAAGIAGLERYGAGTASVRFICGTFAPHVELEHDLASFSGTEAALTYASCWNANEAVIPTLADAGTVLFSDELNHASIVDAMRLARPAGKVVYPHADMDALEQALAGCEPGLRKLIVTDGVFSMEGDLAPLPEIVELAKAHDAAVMVDDSHGTGVLGAYGHGTAEHFHLHGEIDVVTSTLGKALGGGAGGYVASSAAVIDLLAQQSRPQLFSNALPPTVACSARRALEVLLERPELVQKLHENAELMRSGLHAAGFDPLPGEAGIIPVIVGETAFAIEISQRLLERGVFVTGFGYPVVPQGRARVRVQVSAAHEREQLESALAAFEAVGQEVGLLPLRS